MQRTLVLVILLVGIMGSRRADACHPENSGPALVATAVIGIPWTVHDLAIRHTRRVTAGIEVVVMGAATAINAGVFIDGVMNTPPDCPEAEGGEPVLVVLAIWSAALTAHGIYELVTERRVPVVPTAVTDGEQVGGGLAWIGRF